MTRVAANASWGGGAAWLAGGVLVLAALVRYTSWSNRHVFGRWSEVHFALIVLWSCLLLAGLCRAWSGRRPGVARRGPSATARAVGGAGFLAWGASIFLSSLDDALTGGRFVQFVFFGSTLPTAMLLEWVSMVLLFVAAALVVHGVLRGRLGANATTYRRAQNGLVALVSLGVVLLLLEGGARLLNVVHPVTQGFPTKASMLWTRKFVRLNSLGYRDGERVIQAAVRTKRILLIGDSFTFGVGISNPADRFGDRLERALNGLSTRGGVEVLNAGVPDTHTEHHIQTLKRMLPYRPDYVLLVYVFNDIEHVTRPRRSVVTDPDALSGRMHPLRLVVLNSHLAEQVFVRARNGLYYYLRNAAETAARDPYQQEAVLAQHLDAIDRFFRIAREAGTEARLVPFDTTVRFSESSRRRYTGFVGRVAARGITVWSLAEAFDGSAYEHLRVNSLDGHPNEVAQALVSEAISERFRTELAGVLRGKLS